VCPVDKLTLCSWRENIAGWAEKTVDPPLRQGTFVGGYTDIALN